MLRVFKRAMWVRPPQEVVDEDDDGNPTEYEYPLTDDRKRFKEPLRADGTDDEPDEFDIRDRIPAEFGTDGETPQEAGKRAKKIETLLATQDTKVERFEPDE